MLGASTWVENRAKQACDPCRRKKTKCPREKPICSTCSRLKQQCSYNGRQDETYRIHKSQNAGSEEGAASQTRVQRLEQQVEKIFDYLGDMSDRFPRSSDGQLRTIESSPHVQSDVSAWQTSRMNRDQGRDLDVARWRAELDHQTLNNIVSTYMDRIDCQPLPLLPDSRLASLIHVWPEYTLLSFLAIVGLFDDQDISSGDTSQLLHRARQQTFVQVAIGNTGIETLQSLAMLALGDISMGNQTHVSMSLAMAERIILSSLSRTKQKLVIKLPTNDFSRCCWSIFVLEQMYSCHSSPASSLLNEVTLPEYPASDPTPISRPLYGVSAEEGPQLQGPADQGTGLYCMTLFSIWGKTMNFVRSIRKDESQDLWSASSAYNTIVSELYDFETGMAQVHRNQSARFQDRSPEELQQYGKYWRSWITLQFLFHAIQQTINHPFFHVANRKNFGKFRPPTFLQHTIDQALLHATWIVKLIQTSHEKSFEINDPFLAYLASITATTYLFLVNSKDFDLASQARENFETCFQFLERLATTWPHLTNAINKLKLLRHGADVQRTSSAHTNRPLAQKSVLWEVFDYSTLTSSSTVSDTSLDTVDLGVTTQFLTPAGQVQSSSSQYLSQNQPSTTNPISGGASILHDEAFDSFNIFDMAEMADFSTMNFGRDNWAGFGQL